MKFSFKESRQGYLVFNGLNEEYDAVFFACHDEMAKQNGSGFFFSFNKHGKVLFNVSRESSKKLEVEIRGSIDFIFCWKPNYHSITSYSFEFSGLKFEWKPRMFGGYNLFLQDEKIAKLCFNAGREV
jgi:hypothetical protein